MKRICIVIIVLALVLLGCKIYQDNTAYYGNRENLEQLIIDSCLYERSVDVSDFRVTPDEMTALIKSMLANGQLPWYIDSRCAYSYDYVTGHVTEFTPGIIYNGNIDKTLYEQKVAEIIDACVVGDMNQYQIALAIHDYLVANFSYDESLNKQSGYDLLVNGSAVCSGYASAYQDLLGRVGIQSISVISKAMSHTWNLVNIDGEWYHVDVTWDDPLPDIYGYVSHDFCLLTDEEISSPKAPHYGWETEISCTDTRFSDANWRGTHSQISFSDSNIDVSHVHRLKETVYEPSCQEPGYTLFTCDCGLSFKSDMVESVDHSYQLGYLNDASGASKVSGLVQECKVCGETRALVLTIDVVREWVSENLLVVILVWIGIFGTLLWKKR